VNGRLTPFGYSGSIKERKAMGKRPTVSAKRSPSTTMWDMGYRWTQADIELGRGGVPGERRCISWSDLDLAPEFPVLSDALEKMAQDPEWEILSVQVASYDISATHGPSVKSLLSAVH
jgi:uncharacterized protein Usg